VAVDRPPSTLRRTRLVQNTLGATLLEAIATVALSGLVLSSATAAITASATWLRKQQHINSAIDLARARLEAAIGLPCVGAETCPAPFDCRIEREVALLPSRQRSTWVIRLRSIVTAPHSPEVAEELGGGIEFTTLVARSAPCRR